MMRKLATPQISVAQLKLWIESVDRKTLILNLTMVGIFFVFVFFFLLPVVMHNKKMVSEVSGLKTTMGQASVKIARIPEMTKQKELFGARTQKIRERFFKTEDTSQLIEIISTLAAQTGVTISASRPSSKALELPLPFSMTYLPVSYELILEGSYHNLGTFINSLESYSKNFAVHNFQIAKGEKAPTVHQCTIILTAFVQRADTPGRMQLS